jgi:hypothetical protein
VTGLTAFSKKISNHLFASMRVKHIAFSLLPWIASSYLAEQPAPAVEDIIRQSVQAIHEDWAKAPGFDFCEIDQNGKSSRTYQVLMISGSPYSRLVAVNGNALSPEIQEEEAERLTAIKQQRGQETPEAHRRRVAQYERERRRDQQLLEELTNAMEFTLVGSETVDSYKTYVLDATPRRGYAPKSVITAVLTGMRGKLWVDQASFRWVKVKAEVVHPVTIEGFLARVEPGTEFELLEMPVDDRSGLWLASHFAMQARARILWLFPKSSMQDETYFHYKPNGTLSPEECQQH